MVALLRVTKARVITDWEKAMAIFYSRVEDDRTLLVGSNSIQELNLYLHYFGVWTLPPLRHGPRQLQIPGLPLRSKADETGLLAENDAPVVVHVILVVPRKRLEIFTSENPDTLGSPGLHLSITQDAASYAYENTFFSICASFGKLVVKDSPSGFEIEEDSRGWMGSADLVVTCPVPAFSLLMGPKGGIRVALTINTSLEAARKFTRNLGVRLWVFETKLSDTSKVYICRNAPGLKSQDAMTIQNRWMKARTRHEKPLSLTLIKMHSNHRATHLQQHIDFPQASPESKALSAGNPVSVTESSPGTVMLRIGDMIPRPLHYPFHIDGSQPKLRVARRSSWVEVLLPIYTAPSPEPYDSWTQLLFQEDHLPVLWSLPKVNLTLQPHISIDPKKAKGASWITTFLTLSFSDAEFALNTESNTLTSFPKYELKQSLNTIFGTFAGMNPAAKQSSIKVFQLTVEKSCHTIIFANALRHDLDLGSIVLDVCVVPLTISMVKKLAPALGKMLRRNPCGIILSKRESILWKRLIPALVERCRTWSHKTTCEYRKNGGIPLSVEEQETPLCSCGEGKDIPNNFAQQENGEWAPFAKYATRMALAPIFPVPYVEPSMSEFRKVAGTLNSGTPSAGASSSSTRTAPNSGLPATSAGLSSNGGASSEKCDNCGNTTGPFRKCARCGRSRYCNHACQKTAWKAHKKVCGQ